MVQQGGEVFQLQSDGTLTPVLDLSDVITAGGEQGLLGLTFTPAGDVAYVDFTDVNGDTVIAELTVLDDGTLQRDAMRTVMVIDQPYANHNGGDVDIGPDGMLYIGMGDGGSAAIPSAVRSTSRRCSASCCASTRPRRSDLGYTIPPDNPFVGSDVEGAARRDLVDRAAQPVAVRVRLAHRRSVDRRRRSGRHRGGRRRAGHDGRDAGKGVDFGWSAFEGNDPYNSDQSAARPPPAGATPTPTATGARSAAACAPAAPVPVRSTAGTCSPTTARVRWSRSPVSGEGDAITVGDEVVLTTGSAVTAVRRRPDGTIYVLDGSGVNVLTVRVTLVRCQPTRSNSIVRVVGSALTSLARDLVARRRRVTP